MRNTLSTPLATSACKALGCVFRGGTLPLPSRGEEGEGGGALTKAMLVESLADVVRSAKQSKVAKEGWCLVTTN